MNNKNIINEYYRKKIINTEIVDGEEPHYLIKFLYLYYNIENIEDSIAWCYKNINLNIITINRILDAVWEVIIKKEHFETDELIDKIVLLYIYIYKEKYNKDIDYHIMDKILRDNGKKILNKTIKNYSNKSIQKKIKKSIYNI